MNSLRIEMNSIPFANGLCLKEWIFHHTYKPHVHDDANNSSNGILWILLKRKWIALFSSMASQFWCVLCSCHWTTSVATTERKTPYIEVIVVEVILGIARLHCTTGTAGLFFSSARTISSEFLTRLWFSSNQPVQNRFFAPMFRLDTCCFLLALVLL